MAAKMTVLLDANVVIDLLVERQPFVADADRLFKAAETGHVTLVISAVSLTVIHYLLRKKASENVVRAILSNLLRLVEVSPVTLTTLHAALQSPLQDFEDAVQHESALSVKNLSHIITRNEKDFKHALLPVYSPALFVATFL